MGTCNATHQGPRTRRGTDLDVARITAAAPLGDQAVALAALHQRHRRLVAGLQAFGQLADRAPAAPVEAVQVQQQQIRSEERRVGKSVSVRVDLGGRRIIKKKKKNKKKRNIYTTKTK